MIMQSYDDPSTRALMIINGKIELPFPIKPLVSTRSCVSLSQMKSITRHMSFEIAFWPNAKARSCLFHCSSNIWAPSKKALMVLSHCNSPKRSTRILWRQKSHTLSSFELDNESTTVVNHVTSHQHSRYPGYVTGILSPDPILWWYNQRQPSTRYSSAL